MKKLASIIAAAAMACILAFTAVACSKSDPTEAYVGSWDLSEITGAEGISSDDMALMESMGLYIVLELNQDGTAVLDMVGERVSGTWSAESETEATITFDGAPVTATLQDGKLNFSIEGESMVFVPCTHNGVHETSLDGLGADGQGNDEGDSGAAAGGFSDGNSVTINGETYNNVTQYNDVIIDDEYCTVEVVLKGTDWANDPGYLLLFTNNSNEPINIVSDDSTWYVNGVENPPYFYHYLEPGEQGYNFMYFIDLDGIDDLNGGATGELEITNMYTEILSEYTLSLA